MEGAREKQQPRLPVGAADGVGLRHQALVWRDGGDWIDPVLTFVEDGIRRGEPVSVGVSGPHGLLLREALDAQPHVAFFDMTELGRNPGRIISAMLDFAARHSSRTLRYVSEPCWAQRSAAEVSETTRHEALIEPAFAGIAASVLCLYEADGLDPPTISCAERTHPVVISDGQPRASARYAGSGIVPPECDRPLSAPPPGAIRLRYQSDLRPVRALVATCAQEAGLADGRTSDLVLAASEVAANTLRHTSGSGVLHVWRRPDEVVCQVTDSGCIDDPLVGRRRPAADATGQGLWVVNQVCDLVELRSGPDGTLVRMHVRL
jgi:anti-sigma regulatory factor (Ser/Thr protein kinase)